MVKSLCDFVADNITIPIVKWLWKQLSFISCKNISDLWSSTVYTYVFHRHINDGSFHLAEEKKEKQLPGLFESNQVYKANVSHNTSDTQLDSRISQLLDIAKLQVQKKMNQHIKIIKILTQNQYSVNYYIRGFLSSANICEIWSNKTSTRFER